jgi:hypothetical protein
MSETTNWQMLLDLYKYVERPLTIVRITEDVFSELIETYPVLKAPAVSDTQRHQFAGRQRDRGRRPRSRRFHSCSFS